MYRPEKDDAFYYTLSFLHYLHYYPSIEDEKKLANYHVVSVILRVVCCFVWLECAIHCTMSLKDNVPVDISEDLVGLTGVGNSMLICIFYETHLLEWSRLFRDITDTTKFGTPPKMAHVVKKTNRYSLIFFLYCIAGVVIYGLATIFETGRCKRLNAEKGLQEICGTFTPLWWPHGEIDIFSRLVVTAYQVFSVVFYVPPSAMLCYLIWEAAEVIISKIHHLKDLFEHAFNIQDASLRKVRFKYCVRYHQDILRFTEAFSRATRRMCGQVSFVAAIILSSLGTQALKAYSIGATLHLMGYSLAVFLMCQTGQNIRDETYDIQDAVYSSKWYEVDPKLVKDSQFVLLRSQKPIFMEALPLGYFNYSLLITIVKTAYSYMTLMNSTSD